MQGNIQAQRWLYIVGRVKPGYSLPQLQAKMSGLLRQALATTSTYSSEKDKAELPKVHVMLTPGGAGIQHMLTGGDLSEAWPRRVVDSVWPLLAPA